MSRTTSFGAREQKTRGWRPLARRLLGLLFATFSLLLALIPTPAWARVEVVSTMPETDVVLASAPGLMELNFNEPVFPAPEGFKLYDGNGTERTLPVEAVQATVRATLPTDLPQGSYVLVWRVLSDDSHPESEALPLAVTQAEASPLVILQSNTRTVDILYAGFNILGYLGLFLLVGFTAFDLFVARTKAPDRLLPGVAAIVAAISYFLLVPLTAMRELGEGFEALLDPAVFIEAWSGSAALTLALAETGIVLMLIRDMFPGRAGFWVAVTGAGLALASVLPVGHTRSFGPRWLVMGADLLHAATAAVWLGGLVSLILYLSRTRRQKNDPGEAAVVLGRFSTLAGGLVLLLGLTGIILGVVIVGSVTALVGGTYGRLLLVKLGIVAVIAALAAWNRFGLLPHLSRESLNATAWRQLGLAIRLEMAGLVLVVGLTSALTLQNPRANEAPPEPVAAATELPVAGGTPLSDDLGSGHLRGRFSPGTAGVNVLSFEIADAGGAPIVPVALSQVSVAEPNLGLGPLAAEVEAGEIPGSYRAVILLPVAGRWKITAAVRINELERPAAVVDVVVGE